MTSSNAADRSRHSCREQRNLTLLWRGLVPALGTLFVLVSAVAEFLFPVTYRLSPQGAELRGLLQHRAIAWTEVRRAYCLPFGVKLSPLDRPGRLEPFRGLLLRFAENDSQVLAFIRQARG